ncbi:hypothetical protein IAT38_005890 [Cryptococcus sp. DSM 104549]
MPDSPPPSGSDGRDPPSSEAGPSSWRRRLSQPPLPIPSFRPNIPNLRTALLGYLGEIEVALRRKIEDVPGGQQYRATSPESPAMSGEEWTTSAGESFNDEPSGGSYTSARAGPSTKPGIRQRGTAPVHPQPPPPAPSSDPYLHLLNHLGALREEASKHLPSLSVPSVTMPLSIPNREWLRSLPARLSIVDPALPSPLGHMATPREIDNGAIEGARRRMLDMVHAALPSEEWAGWERLGWEEQDETESDPWKKRARSASLQGWAAGEDDDDEPEYLFPNRTPASAKALARRRAVRSKSLGAASFPTSSRPAYFERSVTDPFQRKAPSEPGDSGRGGNGEEAEGEGADEAEYLSAHPELTDTKLTPAVVKRGGALEPTVTEALRRSDDGKRLIGFEDLPAIWRNNEHILTGYRFIPLHLKTGPVPLLKSAFTLHNETVNIHSHSIPTIFILCCIPIIIYRSPLPDAHPLDTASLISYLIAATSCMSSSAGWHILSGCASKRWFEWGACVDWLIAASFGTVVYNGFYCQPKATVLYCTTNLLCGALGSYLPFQRWFNERKNKHLRISFFLFLCFAMVAPMVHMFYQHGTAKASEFVAPFGLSILSYIVGLLFYAFHFPECQWPGMFDKWGASHQIWHAAIVLAVVLHYRAIFVAHSVKHDYSCLAPGQSVSVAELLEGLIGWRP